MQIKRVTVKNLFGYYSYEIKFTENRPITIIHAPNGYGKTTVLKLIKSILEFDFKSILAVPFEEFNLEFQNEATVSIIKEGDFEERKKRLENGVLMTYFVKLKGKPHEKFPFSFDERSIYEISEYGTKNYYEREVRRRRHLIEVEDENIDEIEKDKYALYLKLQESILAINKKQPLKINFIDSNRLFSPEKNENDLIYDKNIYLWEREFNKRNRVMNESKNNFNSVSESIINYSCELLGEIADIRGKFANVSESKERDFPNRLVEFVNQSKESLSEEEIVEKLRKLEMKREELENLGLVLKGKTTTLPQDKNPNETMLKFYTLYISDTEHKLEVFDDIKIKLELLLNIINDKTKFSNKKMRIDNKSGVMFEPLNTNVNRKFVIPLEKLSSGEKHDFILFYELIFKCDKNCIVLIDEPEISLHVAWQMEFINELSKICEMNGMQAIIATHSPDIVNGNNDLLVSLGE